MKFIQRLFIVAMLLLHAPIIFPQVLETIDKRSLKGKIDPSRENSPIVVHVEEVGYKFESESLSYEKLLPKLDSLMDTLSPEDRVISLTADPALRFSRVADLLKVGRKLDEDAFLISDVPVKIVLEEPEGEEPTPGRLFLGVALSKTGALTLNGKTHNENSLVASLRTAFDSRRRRKVYIQGSREVDKSVFVKVPLSTRYDALVKLLKTVHSSGASPIGIEIDWLKD